MGKNIPKNDSVTLLNYLILAFIVKKLLPTSFQLNQQTALLQFVNIGPHWLINNVYYIVTNTDVCTYRTIYKYNFVFLIRITFVRI